MARDPLAPPGRRSLGGRVLKTIALALLVAFGVGFLIGTLLRRELQQPVRYMGARPAASAPAPTGAPT
ncbi:MAG: hypothetical protein AAGC67_10655 [Myxococcota bacterium]